MHIPFLLYATVHLAYGDIIYYSSVILSHLYNELGDAHQFIMDLQHVIFHAPGDVRLSRSSPAAVKTGPQVEFCGQIYNHQVWKKVNRSHREREEKRVISWDAASAVSKNGLDRDIFSWNHLIWSIQKGNLRCHTIFHIRNWHRAAYCFIFNSLGVFTLPAYSASD